MKLSGAAFSARIDKLRLEHDETRDDIARLLGKQKQIFIDWRNCDRIPCVEDLYKLSEHFGVSINYLVLGQDEYLPDDIALICSDLIRLTPEQREPVKTMIHSLVDYWQKK